MSKKKRLFLVDGSSYIFRAYHATERARMTTSQGIPTNATYVFTNMLQKLYKDENPDYLVMVWDAPGKTFREEHYKEYKANRSETPQDLVPQFKYIRAVVDAFNVATLEKEGFEADDVIATIAEKYKHKEDLEIIIVTGDKDLAQLVEHNVKLYDTMKEKKTDTAAVKEKYGVSPKQLVDVFALMGDAIDNIPGVPGIGEKTAPKLIQEFGSLDKLYEHLDKIPETTREKLIKGKDLAYLSRHLAELDKKTPLEFHLDDFKIRAPKLDELQKIFRELEFHKLLNAFSTESIEVNREEYKLILKQEDLEKLALELEETAEFALDVESTSINPMAADPVGISFATAPGRAYYLPFGHKLMLGEEQLRMDLVFSRLKPILESSKFKIIGQNIKYDYSVLRRAGIELGGIYFDTMLASYLLNPRRRTHNLTELALEHFGHKMITFEDIAGKGKDQKLFSEIDLPTACRYSGEDADITWQLYRKLAPELEKAKLAPIYQEMELPLVTILARMEMAGVKVDAAKLNHLNQELSEREEILKKEIFEMSKGDFNIDSPRQLAEVLFERLGLPAKKKTKTGYSTNIDVLEELALTHPLPAKIIEYRQLSKLKSTYTEALVELIDPRTGRIHTSYNQTVAATGRLSSSSPNLQNIPTRSVEGKKIREAFIAEKGHTFLAADYSQIELRILAHLSGEPALLSAFENGEDIHSRTAVEVFGVKPDEVTSELRRRAKVINFGVLYGMSDFGLSQELKIDFKDAKKYIEQYFERYPRVRQFLDEVLSEARKNLSITTLLGRRCLFPDINSNNPMVRKAAEREAINAPMQGSAADIIKKAMIQIDHQMRFHNMESKMIMQVHDELIFEAKDGELASLQKLVIKEMESAAELKVPLKVDIGTGHNWAEAG